MTMKSDEHRTDNVIDQTAAHVDASRVQSSADDPQQRIDLLEDMLREAAKESQSAAALNNRILRLEVEMAAMRASLSWRITVPLRAISRVIVAVRLAIDIVSRQAQVRNGFAGAIRYYASTLRREGFHGIVRLLGRLSEGVGVADRPPQDEIYHEWVRRYDTIELAQRQTINEEITRLTRRPVISVIVPTFNSDERLLREMINSVCEQIYPDWELCIADDASTEPKIRRLLLEAAANDKRIKIVFRETNGHISEASNSALTLATGEYVALLDHDDILPPHALYMVARYINLHPTGRMFYSDEDKITIDGKRNTPYFKSDWNPQMFLARNMFSHLGVFERSLVSEVGGFRKGYEGSQDYDLALRCVERAGHGAVIHIPHVLYHWRIVPGSTAGSGNAKPYAFIAAIRAVEDHLRRGRISATVEQSFDGRDILRVRYALPQRRPMVTIIIPTRDSLHLTRKCIDSVLKKTLYRDFEIIIVDNGSVNPETLSYFTEMSMHENVRVLRDDTPFNFSALNNRAARESNGEYLCLLNNDIEVISPDWLDEMVGLASQPGTGAVGACLWYPNDTLQHGGILIGLGGVAGHMHSMMRRGNFGYFGRAVVTQNLSAVTAACLVVKRSVYEEVSGLNEELSVAFNDVDFCLRLVKAGYRNIWTPYAELYHHESASRGSDLSPSRYQHFVGEVRWMEERWRDWFERDPAYNPNLSLSSGVSPFSLATPPRIGQLE